MQAVLRLVYPPRCMSCNESVTENGMLCGKCRKETEFIDGLVCDLCGLPQLGMADDESIICDDCRVIMRPWQRGRSALTYSGTARRLVTSFKHGDRVELAEPLGRWLARAIAPIRSPRMLVVPVPVHWTRLVTRRFNQSALLSQVVADATGAEVLPDALIRRRRTRSQDGMTRAERFANIANSITARPGAAGAIEGRDVLLIDDVMTTGATLAAATEALHCAGANRVCIGVVARVAKDD